MGEAQSKKKRKTRKVKKRTRRSGGGRAKSPKREREVEVETGGEGPSEDHGLPPASEIRAADLFKPRPGWKPTNARGRSTAKYADDPTEPGRCHAATKSTGKRCKLPVAHGKWVCEKHGGSARSGGPITNGRTSLAATKLGPLLERVRDHMEAAKNMDETLALAQTLLEAACERYADLDTPGFRTQAAGLMEQAEQASAKGGPEGAALAALKLRELKALLKRGIAEDRAVRHIEESLDRVQAYQVEFARVEIQYQRTMTEKQVVVMLERWVEVSARIVSPEAAIEIARAIGLPGD